MPLFRYTALSEDGEELVGEMEAATEAAVLGRLSDLGHLPVAAKPIDRAGAGGGGFRAPWYRQMTRNQLGTVTRELARLAGARVPLERSLDILVGVAETGPVGAAMNRVLERVRGGSSLADAMQVEGPPFDRLYVNMIRAGESGGSLEIVLARLADYMARSRELRSSIVSAMIYPTILLVVSVLSLVLLLTLVVPQFEQLFADADAALPLSTQVVIATAEWFRAYWWTLLVAMLIGLVACPRLYRMPGPHGAWDRFVLGLPQVGDLVRKLEVARFCRTLGTLVANGVPLLTALSIVKETVGNTVIAGSLDVVATRLKAGEGIAAPLLDSGVFPKLSVHMVRVGEETGHLDVMLSDIAEIYENEVKDALKRLLAFLEPALILTLGVLIGGIIVSILMAILGLNQLAF